jgi:hypothetical protein
MFAGDDEFAALAIDMAQYGFGGGNAVEPDRAFCKLDVHGWISVLTRRKSILSTD